MSQSSAIFAALVIGFIVFVTARGELNSYLAVFGLGPGNSATSTGGGTGLPSLPSLPTVFE